jgi:hypothetical protein
MASAFMIDDRLQIDGFNPTTWTGDFGISKDGFPKNLYVDGTGYTTGMNEQPMTFSEPIEQRDEFIGNMYLNTTAPSVAPYREFPARKFEYSDGKITWKRPPIPWSWEKGPSVGGAGQFRAKDNSLLVALLVAVILFYFFGRMKFK